MLNETENRGLGYLITFGVVCFVVAFTIYLSEIVKLTKNQEAKKEVEVMNSKYNWATLVNKYVAVHTLDKASHSGTCKLITDDVIVIRTDTSSIIIPLDKVVCINYFSKASDTSISRTPSDGKEAIRELIKDVPY